MTSQSFLGLLARKAGCLQEVLLLSKYDLTAFYVYKFNIYKL